jgi:prepilin-type N-terminal cleavage/methylation domain-containing protein
MRSLDEPALRRPGTRAAAGFTLLEPLTVMAVLGVVLTLGVPALLDATAHLRVHLAAEEAAVTLERARILAVRSNTHVAVRFASTPDGPVTWGLYADGDGDGVRWREVRRGTDPVLQTPLPLRRTGASVHLGFPPGPPPRDPAAPDHRLHRLDDPIRLGRSDMASFGPMGSSSSGSLYFTDGKRALAVVRLFGRTGKVKVLSYDRDTETWK